MNSETSSVEEDMESLQSEHQPSLVLPTDSNNENEEKMKNVSWLSKWTPTMWYAGFLLLLMGLLYYFYFKESWKEVARDDVLDMTVSYVTQTVDEAKLTDDKFVEEDEREQLVRFV